MQGRQESGGPSERRQAIVELLARGPVGSQEELGSRLASRGFEVVQATLSRDLRTLGVVKGPSGYHLPPPARAGEGTSPEVRLAASVASWLNRVRLAGHLLVLRTPPGGASALALALDQSGLEDIVGTVAGDDTVIVVAPTPAGARRLARRLERLQRLTPR